MYGREEPPQQKELQIERAPEVQSCPRDLLSTDQSISKLPFGGATHCCKEAVGIMSRDHTKLGMVHDPKSQGRKCTRASGRVLEGYCLSNLGQISPRLGSVGKESACNIEDPGWISGLGRFPREENGNPLQSFCLENSMDRGVWRATVHVVAKSYTQLND